MTGARLRGVLRSFRRRRVLPALVLGALVLGGALLAGCTSVRDDLGTSDSVCYQALPSATTAVHGRGHLQGVRLITVDSLQAHEARLYSAARSAPGPRVQHVCLVAFTGRFDSTGVSMPIGGPEGKLAVVELAYPDNRVLATLIVARPPLPFGHSHIGIF